jgi:hypothetical protein
MKKPRVRHNYKGVLAAGKLRIRGAMLITNDAEGNELGRVFDKASTFMANVGDRLVVCSGDLDVDEVASCEVIRVGGDGVPHVAVRLGKVSDGRVHVMRTPRIRSKQASKIGRVISIAGESTT